MRKDLTPEEKAIIRETQRQGEEEYAKNTDPQKNKKQAIKSLVSLTLGLVIFAIVAYLFLVLVS